MNEGIKTIIYPVQDLEKAKTLFGRLLGVEPTADAPYYVGYDIGDQHVGLDPNGHRHGQNGPTAYHDVDDIEGTMKALLEAGAEAVQDIKSVGGGKRTAVLKDPDGNIIGLTQNP
ncbi:glyoxalase [Actinomadura sp. KC06]|uniref:VOC family protein n=1 Tax=Actinomadura sp. KC06 TaxID=2530369 RepID=UPI001044E40D|nr:VOC family protein [Actinomadura sp. KC06]TDD29743.1 glyoxalase [Actinomadura sp. KC06]